MRRNEEEHKINKKREKSRKKRKENV